MKCNMLHVSSVAPAATTHGLVSWRASRSVRPLSAPYALARASVATPHAAPAHAASTADTAHRRNCGSSHTATVGSACRWSSSMAPFAAGRNASPVAAARAVAKTESTRESHATAAATAAYRRSRMHCPWGPRIERMGADTGRIDAGSRARARQVSRHRAGEKIAGLCIAQSSNERGARATVARKEAQGGRLE